MNLSDYEVIIRPKPIVGFDSVDDLQRWLERQQMPDSAQEIARRKRNELRAAEALDRYLRHRQRTLS